MSIIGSLGAPLITTIAKDQRVSLSAAEWLLTITLLTGALATPLMGRAADRGQAREVLLGSLVVVLAGCVVAGATRSFPLLPIARAGQGLGLGLLPVTMFVARREFPRDKAHHVIATLSITAALGIGLGYR
jgi:predicted MFS family arabinose efflux permease